MGASMRIWGDGEAQEGEPVFGGGLRGRRHNSGGPKTIIVPFIHVLACLRPSSAPLSLSSPWHWKAPVRASTQCQATGMNVVVRGGNLVNDFGRHGTEAAARGS